MISLVLFSSVVKSEEVLPPGTKIIKPDGSTVVLSDSHTLINYEEKETLVRNDDLWQIDKNTIELLKNKIVELEKKGELDDREIQLLKDRLELEIKRVEFYKEQIELKDKINKDTIDKLEKIIEKTKPSLFDQIVAKGGWAGLLIVIGVLIGIGL